MISEKIELLGKGLYANIPDVLTLKGIPTASELDYVGSEDFDKAMIEKILPESIEENINCGDLLELDYYWVCRCLRLLNYGPYYDTNTIFCSECGTRSVGEYQVNLNTIECVPLPEGFKNEIKVSKDELIDFDGDITLKLLTIREVQTAYKDKAFKNPDGSVNRELARVCYMIKCIGGIDSMIPAQIKEYIKNRLSSADYVALRDIISEKMNYGLRLAGSATCPKCGSKEANFIALTDDRFFRPSLGNLRAWKLDRSAGEAKVVSGDKAKTVRKHN